MSSHRSPSKPVDYMMKVKSSEDYAALQQLIAHFQSLPPERILVAIALNKIGTVHFARFAFLAMISSK
ncbi:MAG: hypothetical protein LC749_22105 [Actinobacteria bacterium]|nr:hypothetical protein [Actinomycetota bacterium]